MSAYVEVPDQSDLRSDFRELGLLLAFQVHFTSSLIRLYQLKRPVIRHVPDRYPYVHTLVFPQTKYFQRMKLRCPVVVVLITDSVGLGLNLEEVLLGSVGFDYVIGFRSAQQGEIPLSHREAVMCCGYNKAFNHVVSCSEASVSKHQNDCSILLRQTQEAPFHSLTDWQ